MVFNAEFVCFVNHLIDLLHLNVRISFCWLVLNLIKSWEFLIDLFLVWLLHCR